MYIHALHDAAHAAEIARHRRRAGRPEDQQREPGCDHREPGSAGNCGEHGKEDRCVAEAVTVASVHADLTMFAWQKC
ncbi:hypothetical protein D3C83_195990 [compost metagenome]